MTLGTAGLGSWAGGAAQAGKFGIFSTSILQGMQISGAFGSGVSIGQAIGGKDFSGNDLETWERWQRGIVGGAGAYTGLYSAGLPLPNPTFSIPKNPFVNQGGVQQSDLRLPNPYDIDMVPDPQNPGSFVPNFNTSAGGTSISNQTGARVTVTNTPANTENFPTVIVPNSIVKYKQTRSYLSN